VELQLSLQALSSLLTMFLAHYDFSPCKCYEGCCRALVGFDEDHPYAHMRPPLTTVIQPYFEMGRQSVAPLLDRQAFIKSAGATYTIISATGGARIMRSQLSERSANVT